MVPIARPRKGLGETLARFMTPPSAGDSQRLRRPCRVSFRDAPKEDWHRAGKGWVRAVPTDVGSAWLWMCWGRGGSAQRQLNGRTLPAGQLPGGPHLPCTSGLWNPVRPQSRRGLSTAPGGRVCAPVCRSELDECAQCCRGTWKARMEQRPFRCPLGLFGVVSAVQGTKGRQTVRLGRAQRSRDHHSPGPFKPIILFALSSNPENWASSFLSWLLGLGHKVRK